MPTNVFDELSWRGLVADATDGAGQALGTGSLTAYAGFDPTAASLHVGSLQPLMGLARLQRAGHRPIALLGGGTGLIGDPSGKKEERRLLSREDVERNALGIRAQIERFLDFDAGASGAVLADNAEWLEDLRLMDFLRDVGKHFTVNVMLAKESVRRRVESEAGISYTEFSYMLLQAYDYLVLHDRFGCGLQVGGSDQWGNITAGMDLVRRLRGHHVHGLTYPLVMTAGGQKFGKTEAGTVWLDPARTSPYRFHQFWLNTDDRDVVKYLGYFTWLDRQQVSELERAVATAPERREAQRVLADEVTRMVHGEEARARAERAAAVLFKPEIVELGASELEEILDDVPSVEVPRDRLAGDGVPAADLLVEAGVAASKGEARRLVRGGGVYVNNRRLDDPATRIGPSALIDDRLVHLRKGRKSHYLVRVV